MPSPKPLPTQADLLGAFGDAITGQRDRDADLHRGSHLETVGGASAIIARREAQRDRDLFRSNYFDTAIGDALTDYGLARFDEGPIASARGIGTVTLARTGVAAGTLYAGTRIRVSRAFYETTADVTVAAGVSGATIPVRALAFGSGTAVDLSSPSPVVAAVDDVCFDAFTVQEIHVADGTDAETPETYRARIRAKRRDSRPGRDLTILNAARAAGAGTVVAFESSAEGAATDSGISAVYVGDGSGTGSVELVRAVTVALESVRVLGNSVFVGSLLPTSLSLAAVLELDDVPGNVDTRAVTRIATGAILSAFASSSTPYRYSLTGLAGAIYDAVDGVRGVTFTAPLADPTFNSLSWHASLPLWRVDPTAITFSYVGPQ